MMQTVEQSGYALPLERARAVAKSQGLRKRVLVYATRRNDELLVFGHTPRYPGAGIQVPAGGVDYGEGSEQAAIRELFEETGLRLHDPVYLAS